MSTTGEFPDHIQPPDLSETRQVLSTGQKKKRKKEKSQKFIYHKSHLPLFLLDTAARRFIMALTSGIGTNMGVSSFLFLVKDAQREIWLLPLSPLSFCLSSEEDILSPIQAFCPFLLCA